MKTIITGNQEFMAENLNVEKNWRIMKNETDFYNSGNTKYFQEDYKGAIHDYDKAIELNPNDPQAYIFRGDAKIASGDQKGACLDLEKAGELCSTLP